MKLARWTPPSFSFITNCLLLHVLLVPSRRCSDSISKPPCTRHRAVRSNQAVGEQGRSKGEVVAPRLFEGEARLARYRGAARNPYLGGVATARESSPA